jgi:hypothetical protein
MDERITKDAIKYTFCHFVVYSYDSFKEWIGGVLTRFAASEKEREYLFPTRKINNEVYRQTEVVTIEIEYAPFNPRNREKRDINEMESSVENT